MEPFGRGTSNMQTVSCAATVVKCRREEAWSQLWATKMRIAIACSQCSVSLTLYLQYYHVPCLSSVCFRCSPDFSPYWFRNWTTDCRINMLTSVNKYNSCFDWCSSDGIVTGWGLSKVGFVAWSRDSSLFHSFQTSYGAHMVACSTSTLDCFTTGIGGRSFKMTPNFQLAPRSRTVEIHFQSLHVVLLN